MNITAILASLFITGAILLLQNRRKRRFAAGFRIEAEAAFARLLTHPAGVEIVSEKEEIEQSGGALLAYVPTRIARMPAGDYCFFMFRRDGAPYCEALDDATARVLLGPRHILQPD